MHPTSAAARSIINTLAAASPRAAGRVAFELWRRPLVRGRVRAAEHAVHTAARRRVLDIDGRDVITYEWGDGRRPVLLVHGWRSRASRFSGFVSRLLELGYSPVSYDALGHGGTAGPAGTILDHQAIIRRLAERHGRFDGVVAHSLGVPFALYALRHGVAAGRVVAISGVCEFDYLVDAFCSELGLRPGVDRALRLAIERRLFAGDPGIWSRFSAADPAGWGDGPLLVVHNDTDTVVDPAQAGLLTAAYGPRARRIATTGLGHGRILSDPRVIEDAVAFLAEPSTAAPRR
ncbi:alpha/beta hydrolase [Nocardiopsis mangrovi]|uniref:Alpha/beta hydrolase n=1 Tax=Nocardiopsis mangrovi TaxID=1179818 RepID=A0ABV9E475_9ACTN